MEKTFIPQEFREKYEKLLGAESSDFFRCCRTKIPKSIWVNSLRTDPKKLSDALGSKGWGLKPLFHENAFALEGVERPGQSEEFKNGLFNLQEKASMLPAIILNPQKNGFVLDACAAPGNKTLQLACIMEKGKGATGLPGKGSSAPVKTTEAGANEAKAQGVESCGKIVAADNNVQRFRSLRFNVKKFGMRNVVCQRQDILTAKKMGVFDKILLDAPCSSEGLVRKDLDALRNWTPRLVAEKAALQKKLLAKCLQLLKRGGELVYSTCSLSPEEGEEVVQEFLGRGKIELLECGVEGFRTRTGLTKYDGKRFDGSMVKAVRILPQDNDSQTFFIAKMKKL